jgi:hypothetical protein
MQQAPLIILCPPRSFSSVICAMIGQHPELYGFPELNLFAAETMEELLGLDEHEAGRNGGGGRSYIIGLLRVVSELRLKKQTPCALSDALTWIHARRQWTTKRTLDWLLGQISPRMGVEKSTCTATSRKSMERARALYPGARFLHLTRHPATSVQSMLECHRLFQPVDDAAWDDRSIRKYCAQLWSHAHRSIMDFTASTMVTASVPGQCLRIRAEDLLLYPDTYLLKIASWLALDGSSDAIEAMKHPEYSPYARAAGTHLRGDTDFKFSKDPRLRAIEPPPAIQIPPEWGLENGLARELARVANTLGYS